LSALKFDFLMMLEIIKPGVLQELTGNLQHVVDGRGKM